MGFFKSGMYGSIVVDEYGCYCLVFHIIVCITFHFLGEILALGKNDLSCAVLI